MKTTDKQQLKDGEGKSSDQHNHAGNNHENSKAEPAKSCHDNYGFEDDSVAIPISATSTTNNNVTSERLRLNNKEQSVALSENVGKTNFNDVEAGQKQHVNGSEIELVSLNGSKGSQNPEKVNGNAHVTSKLTSGKGEKEHPLMEQPPLTDYFIPVNTHRKLLRGEKLYVTKDRRSISSRRWRKVIICGIIAVFLAIACVLAALAATGMIMNNSESDSTTSSTADNFSELFSSNEPTNFPEETITVGTFIQPRMYSTVSPMDPSLRTIDGTMKITNLKYDDSLSDPTSLQHQSLTSKLENELFKVFNPMSVWGIHINGFRPGSVWVDFSLGWHADNLDYDSTEIGNHFRVYLDKTQWFLNEYKINESSIVLSDFIHPTSPASIHEDTISTFLHNNSLFVHEDHDTTVDKTEITNFVDAKTPTTSSIKETEQTPTTPVQFPWHLFGLTSQVYTTDRTTSDQVTDAVTRNTKYWRAFDGWNEPSETTITAPETTEITVESSTTENNMEHYTSDEITDLWTPPSPRTTTETIDMSAIHVEEDLTTSTIDALASEATTKIIDSVPSFENHTNSVVLDEVTVVVGHTFNETVNTTDDADTIFGMTSKMPVNGLFNVKINMTESTIENSLVTDGSLNSTNTPETTDSTLNETAENETTGGSQSNFNFFGFNNFTTDEEVHMVFTTLSNESTDEHTSTQSGENILTKANEELNLTTTESEDIFTNDSAILNLTATEPYNGSKNATVEDAETRFGDNSTSNNETFIDDVMNTNISHFETSSSINDSTSSTHINDFENETNIVNSSVDTTLFSTTISSFLFENNSSSINESVITEFTPTNSHINNFENGTELLESSTVANLTTPHFLFASNNENITNENKTIAESTIGSFENNTEVISTSTETNLFPDTTRNYFFITNGSLQNTSHDVFLHLSTVWPSASSNETDDSINDTLMSSTDSSAVDFNMATVLQSTNETNNPDDASKLETTEANATNNHGINQTGSTPEMNVTQSDELVFISTSTDAQNPLSVLTLNHSESPQRNPKMMNDSTFSDRTGNALDNDTVTHNFGIANLSTTELSDSETTMVTEITLDGVMNSTSVNDEPQTMMSSLLGFNIINTSTTTEESLRMQTTADFGMQEVSSLLDEKLETTGSFSNSELQNISTAMETSATPNVDTTSEMEKEKSDSIFSSSEKSVEITNSEMKNVSITLDSKVSNTTAKLITENENSTLSSIVNATQSDSVITSSQTAISSSDIEKSQNDSAKIFSNEAEDVFTTTTDEISNEFSTTPYLLSTPTIITKANFNKTQSTHDRVYFVMDDQSTENEETVPISSGVQLNITVTINGTSTPSMNDESTPMTINETGVTTAAGIISTSDVESMTTPTPSVPASTIASEENMMADEKIDNTKLTSIELQSTTVVSDETSSVLTTMADSNESTDLTTSNLPTSTISSTTLSSQATTVNELNEVTYSFDTIVDDASKSSKSTNIPESEMEVQGITSPSTKLDTTLSSTTQHEKEMSAASAEGEKNYYDAGSEEITTAADTSSSLTSEMPSDRLHVEYNINHSNVETSSPSAMTTDDQHIAANDISDHFHDESKIVISTHESISTEITTRNDSSMASTEKNTNATTVKTTKMMTDNDDDEDLVSSTAASTNIDHPNEINDDGVKQYGMQKSNSNILDFSDQLDKSDDSKSVKDDEAAQEIHYGDDS